jgi:putative ATPase
MTLFEDFSGDNKKSSGDKHVVKIPLAERMRPENLEEFAGQEHLVGNDRILKKIIEDDVLFSMIFWGPPGCGKTTLAKIIAKKTKSRFISYSAVVSGIKQIKDVMERAEYEKNINKKRTILFIDEIHRFNKAQQDAFLPYVESGTIILIGATTENPSFEIINALLSRCKVFVLNKLGSDNIRTLLARALKDSIRGFGNLDISIDDNCLDLITGLSDGDSRIAYNILEMAVETSKKTENEGKIFIDEALVEDIFQKKSLLYDKNGEEHYNIISALHKSMRGSDPDAAIYWTLRMIEGGEDPMYIIRRIVRFASEDIGLADPNAVRIALNAKDAFDFIGPPEGYLAIIQAVIYLSVAPKSNALYEAYNKVQEDIKKYQSLSVPYHIRNAPTKLMKEIGYSKGYLYPHNFKDSIVDQDFLPVELKDRKYYFPSQRGFEKEILARLENILKIKKNRQR